MVGITYSENILLSNLVYNEVLPTQLSPNNQNINLFSNLFYYLSGE